MLYAKGVYLYYLSLKKLGFKFLKEFFFSTSFYNKLLKSNIPKRFFFYPNPYLLSPLLNHKSFLFKISNEDIEFFWENNSKNSEEKSIHSFLWLNLIDRKNESKIIQKLIEEWITKYGNYTKNVWDENLTSKRIISWISNAEIISDNTEKEFQEVFFSSLIKQINFIKKNFKSILYETSKIASISAIILSGLVFKEYYNNYNFGLKELKKIISTFFDKNGFPKNRNSENLIIFLQYFILIKEWIKIAQEPVPDYLTEMIEKNLICLNSLKNSTKKLPLFNGVTEKNFNNFFEYLNKLNYQSNKDLNNVGEIQIIKNKKITLYFESGEPPPQQLSRDYQSGPLSFEYVSNDTKVITNCGYGRKISKKIQLLSKITSAQSTLCLNDTSVVKFKKNSLINKAYGSTINNTFKISDVIREENKNTITVSATHNAYLDRFGYLHKRLIQIDKKDNNISGTDYLIKKKNKKDNCDFSIRFHIYPGISLVKTLGGKSILLQIDKKNSWVFESENADVQIEKSLFFAKNKILNNNCIVIYGKTNNDNTNVKWKIKKSN